MKKGLYLLAALSLAASTAFASKARQAALSNTTAITDIQSIFLNPADVHYVGEFATFEMGDQNLVSTSTSPHAEGGFLKSMGDAKFGFYLGKTSSNATILRDFGSTAAGFASNAGFLIQENPFEVFYGAKVNDLNWALSFSYSASDEKGTSVSTDDRKQSAMGTRIGVKTDSWGAYANIGLSNTAKVDTADFKGKSGLTLGGHYIMDTMKVIAKYEMAGAKATDASAQDVLDYDISELTIGFTNAWKSEGNMAFYGLAYKVKNEKFKEVGSMTNLPLPGSLGIVVADDTKIDTTTMPFTLGAEVLATSWMKLRGSITQNILLGSKKTGSTGADTIAHNTTTAAGAGFVWGKNNLDVVLKAMGATGALNAGTDFGTNASYTYMF